MLAGGAVGLIVLMVATVIVGTVALHPFFALWFAGFITGTAGGLPPSETLLSLQQGFGDTVGKVGVIIVSGSVIGCCLDWSGGAAALANKMLRMVGERHAVVALAMVGVVVSTAVFADCGLLLCFPVCGAIAKKGNRRIPHQLLFLALAMGLSSSHSMVPPTPGPVAAAIALDADLSLVFLYGLTISIITNIACAAYIHFLASLTCLHSDLAADSPSTHASAPSSSTPPPSAPPSSTLPPSAPPPSAAERGSRPTHQPERTERSERPEGSERADERADESERAHGAEGPAGSRVQGAEGPAGSTSRAGGALSSAKRSPRLVFASAPILVPIILISTGSIAAATSEDGHTPMALQLLGSPPIALAVGVAVALAGLIGVRQGGRARWRRHLDEGLGAAAPIVLLTGMGGGLGAILRDSGVLSAVSN